MNYQKLDNLLIEYLNKTLKKVKERADKGEGRQILGEVINRPEDVEIEIDRTGEEIIENLLKKYN